MRFSSFTRIEFGPEMGKFSFHREGPTFQDTAGQCWGGKRENSSAYTLLTCVAATLKYGGFSFRIR